ncbi:Signal transduction histidine kinase [Hahella chejuensis KCTC 2396]|uniref:histidine kinase n=1 Tax=Hahella chejuensis (strain KCTC 2396) TaxID=349521 RepID=Q2SEJ3_HAHCH|nr:HAMP domain-containing sensor histidine kinase [Hahella chejuensis]ABC30931.1 Signal transduction histidine kinase [Hahella chejuensis KCTC 2396]
MRKLKELHVSLLDKLIPGGASLSEAQLSRRRVLVGLLLYGFISAAAMAMVRYATDGWTASTLVVAFATPSLLSGLIALWWTGRPSLAADLLLLSTLFIILATAWSDGGLTSRVLTWLPALPLIASFVGDKYRAPGIVLLAAIGLFAILKAHDLALIQGKGWDDSLVGRMSASVASMSFVAIIAHIYEEARRRAEAEKDRLDHIRREWVAVVSHELRTPLTAIQGSLGLLQSGRFDHNPDQKAHMLQMACNNTVRLVKLVNEVLDIERIESGRLTLELTSLNPRELIQEAVDTIAPAASLKNVSLRYQPQDATPIKADHDRLLQVLQNLLSNALKFSPSGGVIEVKLKDKPEQLNIDVIDQGPGIPQQLTKRLFTRFAQATTAANRSTGGSGLGLYISKAIIEQHQGRIGFENQPEGGCRFFVELPRDLDELDL